MEAVLVLVWIGLALLLAFMARRSGYGFWAYFVLSLLDGVLIGWATLRVARGIAVREELR